MKVSAQSMKSMDSPLSLISRGQLEETQVEHQSDIHCEGDVVIEQAFIEYDAKLHGCRPYLMLVGRINDIRGNFPQNVTEISLDKSQHVICYYRFTNDELADLCKKGLFDEGFECPEIFYHNTFELPMVCNCDAITPESEGDIPLLFIGIQNQYNIKTDSASSGYSITEYFNENKCLEINSEFLEEKELPVADFSQENVISDEQATTPDHDQGEPVTDEPMKEAAKPEDKIVIDTYETIASNIRKKMEHFKEQPPQPSASHPLPEHLQYISDAADKAASDEYMDDEGMNL